LARVLSGELEAVGGGVADGERVVDEVEVVSGPLLVVLDEAVVEVTAGKGIGAVLVETYRK
jgi:hypothetical protein